MNYRPGPMLRLVLLLAGVGLFVGLLPLIWELAVHTHYGTEVEYNGVYEPLRDVQTSRAYATSADITFQVRSGLYLRRAVWFAPLIGAAMGAALAVLAYAAGLRLTVRRRGA